MGLVTFTEETLNGKLFCVMIHSIIIFNTIKQNTNIFSQRHKFLTINLVNIELNVLKVNNKDNRITLIGRFGIFIVDFEHALLTFTC